MRYILNRIKTYILRDVYKMVTQDDFLRIEKNLRTGKTAILIGNKRLTENQTSDLASEARAIRSMNLYGKVMDSLRWTSIEAITCKSTDMEQVNYNKAVLYAIDVIEKKIENISKI